MQGSLTKMIYKQIFSLTAELYTIDGQECLARPLYMSSEMQDCCPGRACLDKSMMASQCSHLLESAEQQGCNLHGEA